MKDSATAGVRALLCTEHGMSHPDIDFDHIDQFVADPENRLWLDIDTSRAPDLSLLGREFGFHELALEDAARPSQRPKIDTYPTFSFLVFYSVGGTTLAELTLRQLSIFVGANYLVTVHDGALDEIDGIAQRWQQNIAKIDRDIGTLLYSLLDAIVDSYFPVIDWAVDRVEEIEESVFEQFSESALQQIFALKKSLLGLRRAVAPERDLLNVLIRRESPLFGEQSVAYFQDVYDHLVRVTDSIDIYRDLLSSALDAYISMASNRLNDVMKTLTSWSIPLMAGAMLAGIWGMNFERMPELSWRYGYPMALSVIALVGTLIVVYFRRRRWL